jgi:pimeloyl-ACP methyl ester carboxylesterase
VPEQDWLFSPSPRRSAHLTAGALSRRLGRPGQHDIQTELFYDYRTNVPSYPAWQQWLRAHRPPLLVLWGRYDPSFETAEAEAYRRDVPDAEVHLLDAGHLALDEQPDLIAELTRQFLRAPFPG